LLQREGGRGSVVGNADSIEKKGYGGDW